MDQPKQLSKVSQDKKEHLWELELGDGCYRAIYGQAGKTGTAGPWRHVKGDTPAARAEQLAKDVEKAYRAKEADGYVDVLDGKPIRAMVPKPWSPPDAAELLSLAQRDTSVPMMGVRYPTAVQPRLNGVYGMLSAQGVRTRKGGLIKFSQHFAEAFRSLRMPDLLALDGVIYNHAFRDSPAELNGLVSSPGERIGELKFVVMDGVFRDDEMPFKVRYQMLFDPQVGIVAKLTEKHPLIQAIPTYVVRNQAEDEAAYRMFTDKGYGGMLYRDLLAWYTEGASKNFRERLVDGA